MFSMKSAAVVAIALWVCILVYLSSQVFGLQGKTYQPDDRLSEQLLEALSSLRELRKQNGELKEMITAERKEHDEIARQEKRDRQKLLDSVRAVGQQQKESSKEDPKKIPEEKKPKEEESSQSRQNNELFSRQHEETRRNLDRGVWEIFYYMHRQFKNNKELDNIRNRTEDQLISLLGASANLSDVDDGATWRKKQLQEMTDRIQGSIEKLQNPTECNKAKTLVCNLDKECGFGCQLHHVAYCFVTAFGAGRMMVLHNDGQHWRYSSLGWTGAFKPISRCTYKASVGEEQPATFAPDSTARVVFLGIVDGLSNRPAHLPLSFPTSLSNDLLKLHSNPPAYFISQFIWYLMRSNKELTKILQQAADQISFGKGPIVGLQVRRTDKVGTEAAFHGVDEYMEWAEIWFRVQEKKLGRTLQRRVYVASDDPQVVPETKKNYPAYEVYGDISIANTAQLGNRYTDASLHGVVTDIRLLSQCDYLVCTFSSQVCRMGFELMQVLQGDAGEKFHSLDDLYYYGGQFPHEQVAVEDFNSTSSSEIEIRIGDVIGIAGNHWDGWSKGQNRRTGKIGLYPSYKAIEKWRIVDFDQLN